MAEERRFVYDNYGLMVFHRKEMLKKGYRVKSSFTEMEDYQTVTYELDEEKYLAMLKGRKLCFTQ